MNQTPSAKDVPDSGTRYERKHLELLQAAAAVFAEQGYHDTSVRDLARRTGRSLSGLYYYFAGKEELLYQIQHHCYSTLLETVGKAVEEAETAQGRLLIFISHHLAFFHHNMNEMKVLAHEDVTLGGEYGTRILEVKREYSQMLIDILEQCNEELPPVPGRPSPEAAAFILFGAMNWLYTWPRRVRELPAEKLAADIAQIFLCGFPGCPGVTRGELQRTILCAPQDFWKEIPADQGPQLPVEVNHDDVRNPEHAATGY